MEQLRLISVTVKDKSPCRLLVFGLGNDSVFWSVLNRSGVTVFLEDNKDWYEKITQRSKNLTAYLVNYHTKRNEWKTLLESPSLLDMNLPNDILTQEWNVILVDAPAGWNDQSTGRMKSIFLASQLVGNSGDVFVDDCDREVENNYSTTFLKKENLKTEIQSQTGLLRHYHIKH